jgi:hypothetical protein
MSGIPAERRERDAILKTGEPARGAGVRGIPVRRNPGLAGAAEPDGRRPLIVHNIGRGPKLEDMLFDYRINGHFRHLPEG